MSHCTNFTFQYTDRNLILQTFSKLNLRCTQGEVCTYSSGLEKTLGINAITKRAAIIAEKNGFQYFMENMGSYYQLSIEKHNMSYRESNISKNMAHEFQKQYVKCAAEVIIKQMEKKGQNCLLEENNDGFEIKFGSMYEKSLLVKLQNGRVVESVRGVKGQGCQSLTEALENMLSSADVELNTEWTEEYYEPDDGSTLKVYDLGL